MPGSRPRSLAALGLVAVALLASHSRADEPLRAVVRIITPDDRAVFGRIEGQVTDLAVKMEMAPSEALEADIAGQLTSADAIAQAHGAGVVVWLAYQERELLVFVSEPRTGRILVRRLPADASGSSSSATLETAALVVRSALRALAEGGVIGVERREIVPPPPPPPPVAPMRPAPPPPIRERRASVRPTLGLGYAFSIDGLSDAGAHAVTLSGGLEYRALGLRLEVAGGFPTTLSGGYGAIRVSRETTTLVLGLRAVSTRVIALDLEVLGGATLFFRDAIDATPNVTAAASSVNLSATVGAQLALRVRPWPLLPWRLAVGGGAGVFLPPMSVGYLVQGQYAEAGSASIFPRFFAAFEWSPAD